MLALAESEPFGRPPRDPFREDGPASRTLVIETADNAASKVRVSVHDTGLGVDEQNIQNLFTPFHTTKAEGLGMGLAISRSIIEQHLGKIWAERNPDRGMSFHFTLPGGG